MPDVRSLSVPEGLEGERVDAALARLFGLSRTKAADLASAGAVTVDQRTVRKSDRVAAGAWLEVSLPDLRPSTRLEAGADPTIRTCIDDLTTPLEEAEAAGFAEGAALLRQAMADRHGN